MKLRWLGVILCVAVAGCTPSNTAGAPTTAPSEVETSPATTSASPSASEEQSPSPSPTPSTQSPSPSPTPAEPSASPTKQAAAALLKLGDEGDRVRELNHRLRQISWLSGDISAKYGEQTKKAVTGFQAKRGIPQLGYVDQATWDRLVQMTRKPTHDEMYNVVKAGPALFQRGATGAKVKDLQARLRQIGWYSQAIDGIYGPGTESAVKGFQAKRGIPTTGAVDQTTLDKLYAMTRKPTAAELSNKVSQTNAGTMTLDSRCLQGRVVCISKSQRRLAWVVDGKIQTTMQVRFGTAETPTRNGSFSVYMKSRDHFSTLYDVPMPYALFFSGGQAVHYSADFAANGYNGGSHGCVNVRDRAAVSGLFDMVRVGDRVVVY